ncbi:MAG: hypothetical protein Q9161_006362 [Pseudevernia consocians]
MTSDKEINSSSVLDKELSPGDPDRLNYQNGHLRDPEMEGLTLYEKKALLVNRELDSHGMGKYQWYIFFLCGFGYLVDLLYAQAFGLVEPAMQQEFGFGKSPKFLLYRGSDEKAVEVLQKIAKFNGRESSITLETFEALTNEHASMANRDTDIPILDAGMEKLKSTWVEKIKIELQRYKMLFSNFSIARLTLLVWITYIFDYWGFSIAGE